LESLYGLVCVIGGLIYTVGLNRAHAKEWVSLSYRRKYGALISTIGIGLAYWANQIMGSVAGQAPSWMVATLNLLLALGVLAGAIAGLLGIVLLLGNKLRNE
jgi:hypothetical protein